MTDVYESLGKLGLTRNEVTIYKYLLRKGLSTGAQIWNENSLDKSSAYRALGELQDKGLVYAIGETRNQKFAAHSGEALIRLHEKVTADLAQAKRDISGFLNDINSYAKEQYKTSRINVFEGQTGYKLFYMQRLQGAVKTIYQFGPWYERNPIIPDYYDFMNQFINERVKRGIALKALIDKSAKSDQFGKSDSKTLKEVRRIDVGMDVSAMVATHGDSISINTKEDGAFLGLIIKDRLIASLITNMFEYIWKNATVV